MTTKEKMRLAIAADVSLRTIQRFIKGRSVFDTTRERIEAAATQLGLDLTQKGDGE